MSEDDEIKQDASEGQTDSVPEMAEADKPAGPSGSDFAKVEQEGTLDETAGVAGQVIASMDESGGPSKDSERVLPEMAVEGGAALAPDEAATAVTEPESETVPESAVEQTMEPVFESATEAVEIEAMPEEVGEMTLSAVDTPQLEVAEPEIVKASVAPVEAKPGAEEAGPAEMAEAEDDRHWYVVHCYSGYENKVRHNLEQRIESMGMKDKIFDVVVPTEEEIEVKEGKRRTVERRVFPGYILVQMIMTEESWYVVRNTPGVTGFVGMGNEPTPLRPEEVAQIIRRMEAEAPRVKVTYKIDQKVRIIDGPFNDFIGTVDDIDMERAKVRVMVSFFGRETPVELDFLQVEKA